MQEDDDRSVQGEMTIIRIVNGGCSPVLKVDKLSGKVISSEEALVEELLEKVESKVGPLAGAPECWNVLRILETIAVADSVFNQSRSGLE